MNKLIFNNKEYELIRTGHPRFRVYGKGYEDIGQQVDEILDYETPLYECLCIRIKDTFYGLKLIENENKTEQEV